jgi:Zn-dependent membrane protease YugP
MIKLSDLLDGELQPQTFTTPEPVDPNAAATPKPGRLPWNPRINLTETVDGQKYGDMPSQARPLTFTSSYFGSGLPSNHAVVASDQDIGLSEGDGSIPTYPIYTGRTSPPPSTTITPQLQDLSSLLTGYVDEANSVGNAADRTLKLPPTPRIQNNIEDLVAGGIGPVRNRIVAAARPSISTMFGSPIAEYKPAIKTPWTGGSRAEAVGLNYSRPLGSISGMSGMARSPTDPPDVSPFWPDTPPAKQPPLSKSVGTGYLKTPKTPSFNRPNDAVAIGIMGGSGASGIKSSPSPSGGPVSMSKGGSVTLAGLLKNSLDLTKTPTSGGQVLDARTLNGERVHNYQNRFTPPDIIDSNSEIPSFSDRWNYTGNNPVGNGAAADVAWHLNPVKEDTFNFARGNTNITQNNLMSGIRLGQSSVPITDHSLRPGFLSADRLGANGTRGGVATPTPTRAPDLLMRPGLSNIQQPAPSKFPSFRPLTESKWMSGGGSIRSDRGNIIGTDVLGSAAAASAANSGDTSLGNAGGIIMSSGGSPASMSKGGSVVKLSDLIKQAYGVYTSDGETDRFDPLYYGVKAKKLQELVKMLQQSQAVAQRQGSRLRFSPFPYGWDENNAKQVEYTADQLAPLLQSEYDKSRPKNLSGLASYPGFYNLDYAAPDYYAEGKSPVPTHPVHASQGRDQDEPSWDRPIEYMTYRPEDEELSRIEFARRPRNSLKEILRLKHPGFRTMPKTASAAKLSDFFFSKEAGLGSALTVGLIKGTSSLAAAMARRDLIPEDQRQNVSYGILAGVPLALGGSWLAGHLASNAMRTGKPMTGKEHKKLRDVSGAPHDMHVAELPGLSNAYYQSPEAGTSNTGGLIAYDPDYNRPPVIAHEYGHADIDNKGGWLSRLNQNYGRELSTGLGVLAAGGVAPIMGARYGPIAGGLAGGAAGMLLGLPTLINEIQASRRGLDMLNRSGIRPEDREQHKGTLRRAFGTYLAGAALPAALIGGGVGLAGLLSSRKN